MPQVVFASEHSNTNTPVRVIQALLGYASPDTLTIYSKLYPSQIIDAYRKTVRSLHNAYFGEGGLKTRPLPPHAWQTESGSTH
jgi:hypothetical protein